MGEVGYLDPHEVLGWRHQPVEKNVAYMFSTYVGGVPELIVGHANARFVVDELAAATVWK
jgi:hypothetical protein